MFIGLLTQIPVAAAPVSEPIAESIDEPYELTAPCPGGPVIDGITLDECFIENFNVGGDAVSIRVWYTKNPVTATRDVEGTIHVLEHWINADAEAQQVAAWGREAWEQYFTIFGRHPYVNGCGNRINVQMEDGVGWGGIAYWAGPGSCRIGIDSPNIRGGGGQWTVYHEFQHYQQYSFDAGCYGYLRPNYKSGKPEGVAEFLEGYADLLSDAVDAALDANGYNDAVDNYNPTVSFYDKSYGNVFVKYLAEQIGSSWGAADPRHHMDAVFEHYTECDDRDTLYVLDSLIPSLRPDLTEKSLFLNFFAANWAKSWADSTSQPELVYTDDDGNPYGSIDLVHNEALYPGSPESWTGESVVDWAGKYYQVRPQANCDFVTVDVDGNGGEYLGINMMAADTAGTTSVNRSGWMGEDFIRTFAGNGVHDKIVASINGFSSGGTFDVSFTCATPVLDILEPLEEPGHVLVGEPASPIAFLARFDITDGGSPVLGVDESLISGEAEGDVVTIVPGTFQQVGESYWAIMLPPIKPDGTQFVDLTICLNGTICDTEPDSLLYEDPGNTDIALVFDGSGSMDDEDTPGEGKRYENAQKAGHVLADLLRVDDRVLVMDFSAEDDPPGCGLPGGDGDCTLDLNVYLPRTDVTGSGTIGNVHDAIDMIYPRAWTPIGAALVDAKNKLQAAPYSLNPKHIILLSDGEENVNPLYETVSDELALSGVVIDTVGLSGEAPADLLADIASDTGGIYRYVPTTGGTQLNVSEAQLAALYNLGLPVEVVDSLMTPMLPGPLGLDDVYDYFETVSQGAGRIFHSDFPGEPNAEWQERSMYVDESVNILRLVVAGKQFDLDLIGQYECGDHRRVEVLPPGADPGKGWIPVSPSVGPPPAGWDIRNSGYNDVVIITNPAPGTWKVRTMYYLWFCEAGETSEGNAAGKPDDAPYDYLMNGSVQSDLRLEGRFLPPIVDNKGVAGDSVPIVATLLNRTGSVTDAVMIGTVSQPAGTDFFIMYDDGLHADGMADDGIFGTYYNFTTVGGSYNVRLLAGADDPANPGNSIIREWMGAFWIDGPENHDNDDDGMPDPWEQRCDLNPKLNDSQGDLDRDGLNNINEFYNGTKPCDPDTDNGGEQDGSEVSNFRNPLWPDDDYVPPIGHVSVIPFNAQILVQWTWPFSYTQMSIFVSPIPGELGDETIVPSGNGKFTDTLVINDQAYYLTLVGHNGTALGDYFGPFVVTPKADPDPPNGAILINNGAISTKEKDVILNISATDTPIGGIGSPGGGSSPLSAKFNEVSGDVEMRISNDADFTGASWEPYVQEKPWMLGSGDTDLRYVFIQFRDGAGNESMIIYDTILLDLDETYLPLIVR
jgi:hypothetical protein